MFEPRCWIFGFTSLLGNVIFNLLLILLIVSPLVPFQELLAFSNRDIFIAYRFNQSDDILHVLLRFDVKALSVLVSVRP